jgi:predicted RNase H-like HicB family nuclease
VISIPSSRLEEDCLALILQHPELKRSETNLISEYFKNSENREVFTVWLQADDLDTVKAELDIAIQEHFNSIVQRDMPPNQVEQRYLEYVRRLKERYLKGLEAKRADSFAYEVESKGSGADLSRLEEEGIEAAVQLKEIYTQKGQRH